jgi:antitoxin (DNA-binding transcriptional repressor) of toxin-antitoxin stability system
MKIALDEFQDKCSILINQLNESQEEIIITQLGSPIAKLIPLKVEQSPKVFGCMKESIRFIGDIVSPINEPWESYNA